MSLDKAIKSGKEKRKPYRKSKVFDHSCRNHGSCPWCLGNRKIKNKKLADKAKEEFKAHVPGDSLLNCT